MVGEEEYVKLGLSCADVCKALDRGINGRRVDQPSQSILRTIEQLTMWVEPAIHISDDLLIRFSISVSWPRSRRTSSSGANEMRSLGVSARRTTMKRSLLGVWSSTGFSVS